MGTRRTWSTLLVLTSNLFPAITASPPIEEPSGQVPLNTNVPGGHNELYIPDYDNPVPGKIPFDVDEEVNYFEKYVNGSGNGYIRRSSCPAVNILANRGYISRDGRNISYEEIAQASRDVFNFGDDNIILVLHPLFASHGNPKRIDLDMLADDASQYHVNCPAAPTRNDRGMGDNVNINMTLLESLLSFSKDGETLTIEDLAEHHHLRHNQSLADNPHFRFGNQGAICSLAQYANLVGILGKIGKNGLHTLFVEDVRQFYVDEDLPVGYGRRQFPYYSTEANEYIDRMTHHIGFQVVRPYPPGDQDGRDVEPVVAKFDQDRRDAETEVGMVEL